MKHTPEQLLDKAKLNLMLNGGMFLTSVALQLTHKISDIVPTAATNGKHVIYNPEFFSALNHDEQLGLMAHEVWHVAFDHMTRIGDRDPKMWNVAGDYVINLMLVQGGFKLPQGGLLDPQFKDWSTEQVYDYLMKNADPDDYPDFNEDIEYGNEDGDESASEERAKEIEAIITKAYTQAQIAAEEGSIPMEIARKIDRLLNPRLDWTELLKRFVDSHNKNDFSFRRPNRRYFPDVYMPSAYSENIDHITVAVDTSGSITQELLTKILSEIAEIKELFNPTRMTVIDCDYVIHNVFEINDDTLIGELPFTGGGGTSFRPVMDWCKDNETNVLLYFTDLYADPITKADRYTFPTMWICYSDHVAPEYGETIYCNYED